MAVAMATLLGGCANQISKSPQSSRTETEDRSQVEASRATEPATGGKRFTEPEELDKLLDAKPMVLAAVRPASTASSATLSSGNDDAKNPEMATQSRGKFRIQLSAESDMDAAQSKKANYEKQLGGSVDMVFDAPYYKLRWGYFDSKQDAEDKLLELSDKKIQGFVVKQ